MAEAVSDRQVVAVLRPFVRACGPLLDALRASDPLGLQARATERTVDSEGATEIEPKVRQRLLDTLSSVKAPGTVAWAEMNPEQRTDWWINRVGRFTSLLTAIPGIGGALADRLPIQDTLGAASQGLLLCAIAGEHGHANIEDRVRLIAWVLFEREIDPLLAAGKHQDYDKKAEDTETVELTEELTESSKKRGKITLKACARTLWRLGRSLLGITDELEKRPHGRFYHQIIGALPVVGMAGDYFGERSGLKRVAKRANKWLRGNPVAGTE